MFLENFLHALESKKGRGPIEIQLYLESFFREEFGLIGAIEEQRF